MPLSLISTALKSSAGLQPTRSSIIKETRSRLDLDQEFPSSFFRTLNCTLRQVVILYNMHLTAYASYYIHFKVQTIVRKKC
jgi:hypothetical protein